MEYLDSSLISNANLVSDILLASATFMHIFLYMQKYIPYSIPEKIALDHKTH